MQFAYFQRVATVSRIYSRRTRKFIFSNSEGTFAFHLAEEIL